MRHAWGSLRRTLLAGVYLAASTVATSGEPPAAEVFGALPLQTDPALSPDGHWIAWIDHHEAQTRIVMFDLEARKLQRMLAAPEQDKVRLLLWHNNQTLLMLLSETRDSRRKTQASREYFRFIAHDVGGGDGRMLPMYRLRDGSVHSQAAALLAAGITKPYTVVMETACGRATCLAEVDTRNGAIAASKVGATYTVTWLINRDGRPLAREDWDPMRREFKVFALRGETVKQILESTDADPPGLGGVLADGSALVLLATNRRDHQAAWALPLDGGPLRLLADDADADITNVFADRAGQIVGVYVSGMQSATRWLEPAAQQRHETLKRTFPGLDVAMVGWSEDGGRALARVSSASRPPLYYLVDFKTHRADIAAEEYPALAGVALGEQQQISYQARDGTDIPAYLTTPPARKNGPLALVVLPHGGPWARDYPQFDWLVQFLATRGYAVLQPQFRGSTGFGRAFLEAGYRQWGGLMQDDVTDGVQAMIAQGIADPSRVCIVGISYGGYAALAGAAFTPDLYACAASIAGISDLPALLRAESPFDDGRIYLNTDLLKKRIGEASDRILAAKSPVRAVKAIKAPILLMFGTGDGVVPTEQSQEMARELTKAGKRVTVVALAGEDHWLSRTETRVQALRALDKFLAEHLQRDPRPDTTAAR